MELLILLFKINLILLVFFLLYRFVFRKLTFYNFNRIYLLTAVALSFTLPFLKYNDSANSKLSSWQSASGLSPYSMQHLIVAQGINWIDILQMIYWSGVMVMAAIFLIQFISLLNLYFKSKKDTALGFNIRKLPASIQPFSFFKTIFIHPETHSITALQTILHHEEVHTKQWHSIDIILGEIKRIFCWFNPAAWLMLAAIRENLEFIADRQVLKNGVDSKAYQYALLAAHQTQATNTLTNNFNFSHLKMRITMMNKTQSSDLHLLKYLLTIPLASGIMLFTHFAQAQNNEKKSIATNNNGTIKLVAVTSESNNDLKIDQAQTNAQIITIDPNNTSDSILNVNNNVTIKLFKNDEAVEPSTSHIVLKKSDVKSGDAVGILNINTDNNEDGFSFEIKDFKTTNIQNPNPHQKSVVKTINGNDNVVLYINGKKADVSISSIHPDNIKEMSVYKGKKALDLYPEIEPNKSVISIITKDAALEHKAPSKTLVLNQKPIIFVDGQRYNNDLSALNPKEIKSVEVIKNENEIRAFDPSLPTENGLIVITTKGFKNDQNVIKSEIDIFPNPTSNHWTIKIQSSNANNTYTLIDVEGKVVRSGRLDNATQISSQGLKNGIYFLKMIIDGKKHDAKLELNRK